MPSKTKSNYCPSDFKMTPEQLQAWIAKRKKCATFKSKKDYTRKGKHRNAKYDD